MKVRSKCVGCCIVLLGLGGIHATEIGAQDVERLKSGVVKITATEGNKKKIGTGFIVKLAPDFIHIVTAAHVVSGDPQPNVQFFSRQDVPVRAQVKHAEGGDEETGMALLAIRGKDNIPTGLAALPLATATRVSGGEDIMVIGHPRGAGDWAIIKGTIASRLGRHVTVNANIDEGNSGGPIIHSGQVVGLIGGAQQYGKGITIGTVREYLEGHGVLGQAPETQGAATAPAPSPKAISPEHQGVLPKEITGKDGAPMVLVPAGEFMMGSREGDKIVVDNERPAHPVYLDTFFIDKYEVTTSQYAKFFKTTNRPPPAFWSEHVLETHGRKPVVGVDWNVAMAYCAWAGKRLPTEAEWEKAARGTDQRVYPWGNGQPSHTLANSGKIGDFDDYGALTDVGSFEQGKSPYGTYDMAGNVWEWTADWYDENYYSKSSDRNPKGPSSGKLRVLRGGSWTFVPFNGRSALRLGVEPSGLDHDIGFRCAQDAPN